MGKRVLVLVAFMFSAKTWAFDGCFEKLDSNVNSSTEPIVTHTCSFTGPSDYWEFEIQGYKNSPHIITDKSSNFVFSSKDGFVLRVDGASEVNASLYQVDAATLQFVQSNCRANRFSSIAKTLNRLMPIPGFGSRMNFESLIRKFRLPSGGQAVLECSIKN